jgi:hypothetical protein
MRNRIVFAVMLFAAACAMLAAAGCSGKKDGGKDGKAAVKQEPPKPDFGAMPKDLCDREAIKKITMDVIDNQVFIVTDRENLWAGQTLEGLVEMAKSMAEGFLDMVPEPENCTVKEETVACDDALATLNKANGGAYDDKVMKKNLQELKVAECGLLTQEMDAWGARHKTLYYVGKIGGKWEYIFNVSQMQLDMQTNKEDSKAPAEEQKQPE